MNGNEISLVGNAADDVALSTTKNGTSLAKLRLGSTPRRFDRARGEWVDEPTLWITVVCWRHLAEHVAESVRKGDPLLVRGRLRSYTWARDGLERTDFEIIADAVGHDLVRGTAAFARPDRSRRQVAVTATDTGGSNTIRASGAGDWGALAPVPDTPAVLMDSRQTADIAPTAEGASPQRPGTDGTPDPWAVDSAAVTDDVGDRAA